MATVELQKVQKVFGQSAIIPELDLHVHAGEFLVLVGPSGCGKSTLLRLIAGLEDATTGSIIIDGQVVNDVSPKDRNVAMVFQNYALYPHMSVRDNLAFGLRLAKVEKSVIARRIHEVAEILGLGDQLAKKPGQLSGGQKQRVAMGRAMVRSPKVFLFDEPLSNLDAQLRGRMRAEIALLHQRLGATMIYVTHDQVEAMTLADRIAVLNHGRVEQIGSPLSVYNHPRTRFVAGFLGTPSMNFLPPALLPPGLIPARATEVGCRPEALEITATDVNDAEKVKTGIVLGQAQVVLVELLGSSAYVHARLGEQTLIAEHRGIKDGNPMPTVGGTVTLKADRQHLFYFDRAGLCLEST